MSLADCHLSSWQAFSDATLRRWLLLRAACSDQQNSRFWGHCFLGLTPHWLPCLLIAGWNSWVRLGGRGTTLTCFENTGLFLPWIKATLPTIQPRSLFIIQLGPKAPANSSVFLVLACPSCIFFSQNPHRSNGYYTIRPYKPLEFCRLLLYLEKSFSTISPLT